MMFLLDSSAVIEILLGTATGSKIREIIKDTEISSTSITVHEVALGENVKTLLHALEFFNSMTIFSFDKESALNSFTIEQSLKKKGKMIERSDMFIAGICVQHDLTLITLDKGFEDIDNLKKIIVA